MESGDEVIMKMLVTHGCIKTGLEFGSEGRSVSVLLANYPIIWRTGGFFLFADEHNTISLPSTQYERVLVVIGRLFLINTFTSELLGNLF